MESLASTGESSVESVVFSDGEPSPFLEAIQSEVYEPEDAAPKAALDADLFIVGTGWKVMEVSFGHVADGKVTIGGQEFLGPKEVAETLNKFGFYQEKFSMQRNGNIIDCLARYSVDKGFLKLTTYEVNDKYEALELTEEQITKLYESITLPEAEDSETGFEIVQEPELEATGRRAAREHTAETAGRHGVPDARTEKSNALQDEFKRVADVTGIQIVVESPGVPEAQRVPAAEAITPQSSAPQFENVIEFRPRTVVPPQTPIFIEALTHFEQAPAQVEQHAELEAPEQPVPFARAA